MNVDIARQPADAEGQSGTEFNGEPDQDEHDAERDNRTAHDFRVALRQRTVPDSESAFRAVTKVLNARRAS